MRENWTSDYVGYTDSPFITYPNGENLWVSDYY